MTKRLSDEMTAMTDGKPGPSDPGMKWVKVKKTEMKMDAKGYMVTQDVESWEQQPVAKKSTQAKTTTAE